MLIPPEQKGTLPTGPFHVEAAHLPEETARQPHAEAYTTQSRCRA
mgnify:CR=1 FL=1